MVGKQYTTEYNVMRSFNQFFLTYIIKRKKPHQRIEYRLGGVIVKASASKAEHRGSIPGRVIPKRL